MNSTVRSSFLRFFMFFVVLPVWPAIAGVQRVSLADPSVSPSDGGSGDSGSAIISADGRFVLFASTAENLVPMTNTTPRSGLAPQYLNVFLRDRTGGTTALVSVNPAGCAGNGNSLPAGISTNGRFALFESVAGDLVANDTNNASDVFVRDMISGTTTLVSVKAGGGSGNGESRSPVMTADGRYVAFVSTATNLVAGDTNGIADVFVRDMQTGATTLASVGAQSRGAEVPYSSSESPEITPDGRFVALYSTATNLVPGVSSAGEIYVRDCQAGTTTWASTNAGGIFLSAVGSTNSICCNHRLSDDGRYVAFEACTNQVDGFDARGVVLRHDLQTGVTDVVHTNGHVPLLSFEDVHDLNLTPDGRFIAYVANVNSNTTAVYLWDAQTGTNVLVSCNLAGAVTTNAVANWPAVDAAGRYVVFSSTATDLTTNAVAGLFVRDLQLGTTRLVSVSSSQTALSIGLLTVPSVSADGRFVSFVAPDASRNGEHDVFMRDVVAATTDLISAHDPALPSLTPNGLSGFSTLSVSSNGWRVAFTSEARNLARNDTNDFRDVFVRDLLNGTNLFVSVGLNGTAAAGFSTEPSISGDGRFVAFSSFATNLVTGDTNKCQDVFVRDLQGGTTALVSVGRFGGFGNADSYAPVISADGRYVLFCSMAYNLAAGSYGSGSTVNLFCRDLLTGTTYGLTTSGVAAASATPNGRFVALAEAVASPGNVYLWDAELPGRIYTNVTSYAGLVGLSISADANRIAMLGNSATFHLAAIDRAANTNIEITIFYPPRSGMGLRFSADGRYLAYAASASSTTPSRVYLYDFLTRSNRLISRSFASTNAADASCDYPYINADGRFVAYRTFATNSVAYDSNGVPDLVLYDQFADATILLSASRDGTFTANNRSLAPVFSGNGRMLVFPSWASDLLAHDFNGTMDVFAMTLPIVDGDSDGMDDQWELNHFGTLARNGAGDYDGDGDSDLLESQAGTDPGDPGSSFRAGILPGAAPGEGPTVFWPVAPLNIYRVQYKNDLEAPDWQDLNGNILLFGNTGLVNDPVPAPDRRFYRIMLTY
jgi:Tol biopolymer transport system component